ncbi:hypothetical protein M408DRAFT_227086 [Serendipita vermifera MAFF 305830]|uniref:non-specific serine/threonine protein kinase n=1 Tax=Serendipita vermifera MAFF 305830 TaxID=933852 RepID=A0A0C3AJP7_SERVB|nr:hypothetical protein M408DRAFT_227086 [Serendipita vermifera MAFF 305830]
MGNAVSGPAVRVQAGALDSYVSELGPDIHYDKSIGQSRFLKSVKANHRNGPLLIKVFIKPDPGLTLLRTYHSRLNAQRDLLADIPNVYTYQAFTETDKAGYIIRQWLANSLFDRISTRPFLSMIEKKWIAFQILTGLRDARKKKVAHGSLSTLNILVTSSNWVYITDFASNLKPTNLPLHDPDDFYYFFDSGGGGRGVCCVAPERFYDSGGDVEKLKQTLTADLWSKDGVITEAMDVFSAGCVIAELFTEGGGMFRLADLFRYRECGGDISKMPELEGRLNAIKDPAIKAMTLQMIDLSPSLRPTFDTLLATARNSAFPDSFYDFYHGYVHSIEELPSPSPFTYASQSNNATASAIPPRVIGHTAAGLASDGTSTPTSAHPTISTFSASSHTTFASSNTMHPVPSTITGRTAEARGAESSGHGTPLPRDADRRIDAIWSDFERVIPNLNQELRGDGASDRDHMVGAWMSTSRQSRISHDIFPVEIDVPNVPSTLPGIRNKAARAASHDGTSLIILSLVSSNIRSCILPSSKLKALDLMLFLSCYLTDEAKLDRLIPYVVDLLHDDAAVVRAAAVRTILQVLSLVSAIAPSNASIIPEYILINTKHLATDPDTMVRCIYAQCIAPLTETSALYLEMSQALKAHGTRRIGTGAGEQDESYDAAHADLQSVVQEQLVTLLVDRSAVVKRALLHNTSQLCIFLGRQKANDVLLSHMLTYLNDRDWMLRYAFFQSIVDVAMCVGGRSLDEYILPLMIQALSDTEETVVAKVLQALTELSELRLFQKMRIWELMSAVLGFLYHPNVWIRQAAVSFLASAARQLPKTDVWCILYPSLKYFLRSDVRELDEGTLLEFVKPPVPRPIFDTVISWAKGAEKTQFWRSPPSKNKPTGSDAIRESLNNLKRSVTLSLRGSAAKSEEDEQQISRLQQMGMTPLEEAKLLSMRDYITKLTDPRSSRFSSRAEAKSEQELLLTGKDTVNLTKLGAVVHTFFIGGSVIPARRQDSRRSTVTDTPRIQGLSALSSPRMLPLDRKENAPLDDLRKKLLLMDGSTTSLHGGVVKDRERRESTTSVQSGAPSGIHVTPMLDKSPPESITSGGETSLAVFGRRRQRIQLSSDGKAPPLVGSIRTNVAGLLEAPSTLRPVHEDSSAPSGRSSPVSQAGTLRRDRNSGRSAIGHIDGDGAMATLLEHMNLDTGREAMYDFGPKVKEVPIRRRNNVRAPLHSRDPNSKKADVTLVANLTAHSGPVNGLVVSPDHAFFVSCSDDQTVKVWDTAKLERNVTRKPRHVYTQHHSKVTAICMLENSHCFASAAADGSLHIVRVHVSYNTAGLAKYGKVSIVREHRVDHAGEYITCLLHYNTESASNLIYGTTHGNVVILDLRTMRVLQQLNNPIYSAAITAMCIDSGRTWIVTGSLTGTLTLWDLRFGLSLKSWKVGPASPSNVMTRIHSCQAHPVNRQWILVASESHAANQPDGGASAILVEVWDLEKTAIVETLVTHDVPIPSHGQAATLVTSVPAPQSASVPRSPADAIAQLLQSRSAQSPGSNEVRAEEQSFPADIRSMAVGLDFGGLASTPVTKDGFVLTGGLAGSERKTRETMGYVILGSEDRRLRLWHLGLGQVERSMIVSGLEGDDRQPPSFSTIRSTVDSPPSHTEIWSNYDAREKERQRSSKRPSVIGHHQQDALKSHHDAITAIVCIDSPFRGGIVSGDRSGIIKVYRVLEAES